MLTGSRDVALFDGAVLAMHRDDAKGNFIDNNKMPQPVEIVAALNNYKFVVEDGSCGVHYTKYAVQLLMDTIKSLDKSFDDSRRPL